jgi:hypothetical protein
MSRPANRVHERFSSEERRRMRLFFSRSFGLLACCLFLFAQCRNCKTDANRADSLRSDSVSVARNQPETYGIRLSDLADSIEYVALETGENSLVKLIDNLTVTDKHILIKDGCGLLLFSRKGKFICRVGNMGQGPGEYICAGDYDIDEDRQKIYLWGIYEHKILVYDFSGKMTGSFRPDFGNPDASVKNFLIFRDEQYMAATVKTGHAELSDTTCLINLETGEYKKEAGYICGIDRKAKCAYLRRAYPDRDSIFRINEDSIVFRHAVFQDKQKERDFFMPQLPLRINNREYLLGNWQQERHTYESAWVHVTKKGKVVHYTSTRQAPKLPAVYSYTDRQFCRLEHNGLYQGIVNDIDSGLPFIPRSGYWDTFPETYGHTMATFYLPDEIFEYHQENKPANIKWPACLKEDDNPVVFIIHMKRNQ